MKYSELTALQQSMLSTCNEAIERAMNLYFNKGSIDRKEYERRIELWNNKLQSINK